MKQYMHYTFALLLATAPLIASEDAVVVQQQEVAPQEETTGSTTFLGRCYEYCSKHRNKIVGTAVVAITVVLLCAHCHYNANKISGMPVDPSKLTDAQADVLAGHTASGAVEGLGATTVQTEVLVTPPTTVLQNSTATQVNTPTNTAAELPLITSNADATATKPEVTQLQQPVPEQKNIGVTPELTQETVVTAQSTETTISNWRTVEGVKQGARNVLNTAWTAVENWAAKQQVSNE